MSKKSNIGSALGKGVEMGAGMLQDKVPNPYAKLAIGLGSDLLEGVIKHKLGPKDEKKEDDDGESQAKLPMSGTMISPISSAPSGGGGGALFSRRPGLSSNSRPSAALSLLNQRR